MNIAFFTNDMIITWKYKDLLDESIQSPAASGNLNLILHYFNNPKF